ncbi:hypothetical protein L486_02120 [Kwoniella mangroviensis CBS 10435]|uniref:Uncharacterized protein n=1 Tax=Kwoniella mangroviensis CBS 10435 TaxID=1331196 RepID=A0A1B9IVB1_9TREE|nr:hypothetical protein L486_02120 [Kwoniella mangroviensis CBS 10435]OCF73520.1 hypothetical protein I204_05363 [Kwoniella mangroviensis CBS 8886]
MEPTTSSITSDDNSVKYSSIAPADPKLDPEPIPFEWSFDNLSSGYSSTLRKQYISVEMTPTHTSTSAPYVIPFEPQAADEKERQNQNMKSLLDSIRTSNEEGWESVLDLPIEEQEWMNRNHPGRYDAERSQVQRSIQSIEDIYGDTVPTGGYIQFQQDGLTTEIKAREGKENTWVMSMMTARGAPFSGKAFSPDLDDKYEILSIQASSGISPSLQFGYGPRPRPSPSSSGNSIGAFISDLHENTMNHPQWSKILNKAFKAQRTCFSMADCDGLDGLAYVADGFEVKVSKANPDEREDYGIEYKVEFTPCERESQA